MNKKLIAVAVASALAAPAVYADITPYGRVNNAIDINDDGDLDLSGVASRFGFKGSGDIGNGLTAIGRYEFSTVTDKEGTGVGDTRLAYVGLSGGFGTITMGNQWSAFFNSVGTYMSPTYSLGYVLYSGVAGLPFRTSNTIKYNNSFGPVTLEADMRINDSDEGNDVAEKLNGNGYGLGLTISPLDNLNIAAAIDSEEEQANEDGTSNPDTDRYAVAFNFGFAESMGLSVAYSMTEQGDRDVELIQAYFSAGFGEKFSILVGMGQADTEIAEPTSIFFGAYYNLGGGLRLWGETTTIDADLDPIIGEDYTRTLLGMRIDF